MGLQTVVPCGDSQKAAGKLVSREQTIQPSLHTQPWHQRPVHKGAAKQAAGFLLGRLLTTPSYLHWKTTSRKGKREFALILSEKIYRTVKALSHSGPTLKSLLWNSKCCLGRCHKAVFTTVNVALNPVRPLSDLSRALSQLTTEFWES